MVEGEQLCVRREEEEEEVDHNGGCWWSRKKKHRQCSPSHSEAQGVACWNLFFWAFSAWVALKSLEVRDQNLQLEITLGVQRLELDLK